MKYNNLVKIKILLLSLLVICSGCASFTGEFIKDPTVEIKSLKVLNLSNEDLTLDLILSVNNPNPIPLSLSKVDYSLNFASEKVTSGVFEKGIELSANNVSEVTIPLKFTYSSIGNILMGILNKNLNRDYEITGSANVGIFNIPFSKKGQLKLRGDSKITP